MNAWLESATTALKIARVAAELRRTYTTEELQLLVTTLQRQTPSKEKEAPVPFVSVDGSKEPLFFVDDEISFRCPRHTWRHLAFRKYDLIYSGRDGELDTVFATVEGMETDVQAMCDALNETNHVPVVCR